MASDVTFGQNNDLLKAIKKELFGDAALQNLYNSDIDSQKETLIEVFRKISSNDATASEKATLQAQVDSLGGNINTLEKQMEDLAKKIQEKNKEIDKMMNDITSLITGVKGKSEALEKHYHNYVQRCVSDVFQMYSNGKIGKDAIGDEIRTRIRNGSFAIEKSDINSSLNRLDKKQSKVDTLTSSAAGLIDERNLLEKRFGVTKSAFELINTTLNQIGETNTEYKNKDYSSQKPIYSLEKTSIVADLFANNNVPSGNSAYIEGNTNKQITQAEITEKYKDYLNIQATANVDPNSISNAAVKSFKTAIDEGLLEDLKNSDMKGDDILKFLSTNFAGAKIELDGNNRLSIPYGHDNDSKAAFTKLTNFVNNDLEDRYRLNTWDKDKGNTIDSNPQIAALAAVGTDGKKNYEKILTDLAKGKPRFSFKEAMYALFDKEKGLFKDSGILYDLNMQSSDSLYYSIDKPGDKKTADLYAGIANLIKDLWGVEPNGTSIEEFKASQRDDEYTPQKPNRTDPLGFEMGEGSDKIKYNFVLDSDNNGEFSGIGEFLGANANWLVQLRELADENGLITGENLSKVKLFGVKYTDNAETDVTNGHLHGTTNNVEYIMTDAEKLGITSIDLNDAIVDESTGNFDINGSEIFNDRFKINFKNGSSMYAERQDEESEGENSFMNTIYGNAAGKSFELGSSEEAINQVLDKNYVEFENNETLGGDGFQSFVDKVNSLNNFEELRAQTRALYGTDQNSEASKRMEADKNIQLTKADNRASALRTSNTWTKLQSEVKSIALEEGLCTNSDINSFLEQAKGTCQLHNCQTARQVIELCRVQIQEEQKLEEDKKNDPIILDALLKSFKKGISATVSDIRAIMEDSDEELNADKIVDRLVAQKKEKEGKN